MKSLFTLITAAFLCLSVSAVDAQNIEMNRYGETIDRMIQTVETIQRELQRCNSELCSTIQKNAFVRADYLSRAKQSFEANDSDSGWRFIRETHKIVKGDVDRLSSYRLPDVLNIVLRYELELDKQLESFLMNQSSGRLRY